MSIRCFADAIEDDHAQLSDEETHHLTRVLRLGAGAEIRVFDGAGREWRGRIEPRVHREPLRVRLLERVEAAAEPRVAVIAAVGLLKGDAMSDVVRDLTALGAAAIIPFTSAHTALPAGAWRTRQASRWTRVAIASARQCGRAVVPAIADVTSFDDVLAQPADLRLICVEPAAGDRIPVALLPAVDRALVLTGPEGGWSADELRLAAEHGCRPFTLGPRTLRAELAPAVAMGAIWALWGWP
jgi:16S rRNA (uracil1498-N3)-methyltransferase